MGLVRFLGEGKVVVEPQDSLRPAPGEVLVQVEASALCGSEMHAYRGVFGSHVANVIRRLKRVAAFHGAHPAFILSSGVGDGITA